MIRLSPPIFIFVFLAWVAGASAQSTNLQYQVANLMEDFRLLDERMRMMTTEMDELRRENARLRAIVEEYESKFARQSGNYATVSQVNELVRKAVTSLEARDEVLRKELAAMLGEKLEAFGKKVTDTINRVPSIPAPDLETKTTFPIDGIPTTGVPYTVQSGDTLSSIASKLNSRTEWIQNINKIANARLLQAGQTIFVPQNSSQ